MDKDKQGKYFAGLAEICRIWRSAAGRLLDGLRCGFNSSKRQYSPAEAGP